MAPRSTPTGPGSGPAIAGPLIGALEDAWAAIRARHPDVAPAVIITGSGSGSGRHMLRLGHYAASRWQPGADGDELDEIFIGGEGLARGAGPVLATLLHEPRTPSPERAASKTQAAKAATTTSASSAWRGARPADRQAPRARLVDHDAARQHRPPVRDDDPAPRARDHDLPPPRARRRGPPGQVAGAAVRLRLRPAVRVAPGVLALGPILCSLCEQPFEPLPGPDAPAPAALSQLCTPTVGARHTDRPRRARGLEAPCSHEDRNHPPARPSRRARLRRPGRHPETLTGIDRALVGAKPRYALEIAAGERAGPYRDSDAERHARQAPSSPAPRCRGVVAAPAARSAPNGIRGRGANFSRAAL